MTLRKRIHFFRVIRGFFSPWYLTYLCMCVLFLAEIETEPRVFKYTWSRGLHECDPVLDGEQLWAVSCVGAFDCSVPGFHQPLPQSLRRSSSSLPAPCSQLHFTHCNKAFRLSLFLWCLNCFAAPLHCSLSVKACCCIRECVQIHICIY